MNIVEFNHREADRVLPDSELDKLRSAIRSLSVRVKSSGQSEFRTAIVEELAQLGWSTKVRVSSGMNITVAAMKGRVVACVQTGNVSRLYADLMKSQVLYDMGKCDAAIFVLLTKTAAKAMSSNLAHSDRLLKELTLFRSIINVPIKIISVE